MGILTAEKKPAHAGINKEAQYETTWYAFVRFAGRSAFARRRLLQRQGNAHAHGKAEPHRKSDGEPHRKSHREPHNGRFSIDRAECDGENTIEGFKEGETVEVSNLPEKVTKAVKEKYPNATVKSATYATYMDKQMYHLMLEGAGDNTTEIYAQADGTLLPLNAQSTPEGTGGGANGGSTNKG